MSVQNAQLQTLTTAIQALRVPVVLINGLQRVVGCNAAATTLFGTALPERHYLAGLRQPALVDAIERCLRGRGPVDVIYTSHEAGRDTAWIAHVSHLDLGGGHGVMVSLEDTTAMQEISQMRRDFVANVSHELRTPLTALTSMIETLGNAAREDEKARSRFLEIMEQEASRMNRLVSDLLSLSKVEATERMRPKDRVDLSQLLNSVVQTLAQLAERQQSKLLLVGADKPYTVIGDEDQLRQVFINLIENALKYGRKDGVTRVELSCDDRDPTLERPVCRVDVIDDGAGFDPVHIPRLTERFYRVDGHRDRQMGGTGLGLAIVKHIVNRHRARLKIDSQPGQGSCFSVMLPID